MVPDAAPSENPFLASHVAPQRLEPGQDGDGCGVVVRRRTWRTTGLRYSLAMALGDEVLIVDYSDC